MDGAWLDRYLREFKADAVATLSPEERQALAPIVALPAQPARLVPAIARPFVRKWTMADLWPELSRVAPGGNAQRGRQVFVNAECLRCHRFGNDGGAHGPELTAAASKYDRRSLLESLLEPSRVINEQYQNTTVALKDGELLVGKLVKDGEDEIMLEPDAVSNPCERIARSKIDRVYPSPVSPMPEGLLDSFSRQDIADLIAYIESGGREGNAR